MSWGWSRKLRSCSAGWSPRPGRDARYSLVKHSISDLQAATAPHAWFPIACFAIGGSRHVRLCHLRSATRPQRCRHDRRIRTMVTRTRRTRPRKLLPSDPLPPRRPRMLPPPSTAQPGRNDRRDRQRNGIPRARTHPFPDVAPTRPPPAVATTQAGNARRPRHRPRLFPRVRDLLEHAFHARRRAHRKDPRHHICVVGKRPGHRTDRRLSPTVDLAQGPGAGGARRPRVP